jgi:hypothetical protein
MSATFLGAPFKAQAVYPLYEKSVNLNIHAALGSFDGTKLNAWLVPFERLQVKTGILKSGKIDMAVRNGVAQTSVVPLYDEFEILLLNPNPTQPRGLMEKLKTFVAEAFIIKDGNPGKDGKLRTGVTSTPKTSDMEFMQFIWVAIRKSLGQVIGGFQ